MRASMIRGVLAASLAVGAAAGCEIPQDPRHTLAGVTGDTVHVGVTEAPPWVVRRGQEALGVEAELVRRFARSIGAEVAWRWGTTGEHMEALERYDLDVVVGGLTVATPWRSHVGLTRPYHVSRVLVVGPPGSPILTREAMDNEPVAVSPEGLAGSYVREAGARPVPMDDLSQAPGLVAAPDWTLVGLGRDTAGVTIARHRHVMAVPPGENRFLMALEDALRGADVGKLLGGSTRAQAGGGP